MPLRTTEPPVTEISWTIGDSSRTGLEDST